MLMPIAGKKAGKEAAAKKPASKPQRKSAWAQRRRESV
jgi:DNA end-binding protein Ku